MSVQIAGRQSGTFGRIRLAFLMALEGNLGLRLCFGRQCETPLVSWKPMWDIASGFSHQ